MGEFADQWMSGGPPVLPEDEAARLLAEWHREAVLPGPCRDWATDDLNLIEAAFGDWLVADNSAYLAEERGLMVRDVVAACRAAWPHLAVVVSYCRYSGGRVRLERLRRYCHPDTERPWAEQLELVRTPGPRWTTVQRDHLPAVVRAALTAAGK